MFGSDTLDYQRFVGNIRLDRAPIYVGKRTAASEVQKGYFQGINQAVASLQAIVELFEERIGVAVADPAVRARRAFSDLDLHPSIASVATKLFEDGHYTNAVEDACKALDLLVRNRSGRSDMSGTDLMQTVFSPNAPILRFNSLQTDTDRSEQRGFMFLYAGAMLAVRNPRAHELVQDDAEKALEYIAFLSLLARTLDRAQRVP